MADDQQLEMWDEVDAVDVSLKDLDAMILEYKEKEKAYDLQKEISNAAKVEMEASKLRVLLTMESAKKDSYSVAGLGTLTRVAKYSVKVPKDLDSKKEMLEYFKSLGEDVYNGTVTVQYQTLNSHYNTEIENDPNFKLPHIFF